MQDRTKLIRWLSDIQSTSTERIPVILVFTHMDRFVSREQKDTFRRRTQQWLQHQEKQFRMMTRSYSFGAASSHSIRNLQGQELTNSCDSPLMLDQLSREPSDFQVPAGDKVPLFPLIHQVFFINALAGDGMSPLRKSIIKIASGSLPPTLAGFSGFKMIGADVPTTFVQVEQILRQLRTKFRSSRREGEQRPFYTVSELLHKKLKRPLQEVGIKESEFSKALSFLHEVG